MPAVQADEPAFTRRRVRDFLLAHTAYELVPESGKVVLLDMDLPMRQAFHALHEQGAPAGAGGGGGGGGQGRGVGQVLCMASLWPSPKRGCLVLDCARPDFVGWQRH
jgi:hypothetical protein